MIHMHSVEEAQEMLGQQPPLPGTGHHCRAAVHLDAMVMIPTAARNQVSDPKDTEHYETNIETIVQFIDIK